MIRTLILAAIALIALSLPAQARRLPWCGIYMGKYFHKPDRRLWLARAWAREGVAASGPAVGVVVVWPHHVGVIAGVDTAGNWLVHSGNDGGMVRTRARSLRGVIAYRQVG